MNIEEYTDKISAIEKQAAKDKKKIAIEFALSNNPVSVGDIIYDGTKRIKVDEIIITFCFLSRRPECVYFGPVCTKKNKPSKLNKVDRIYQRNLKEEV